ncbi:MICOS complex subunit MIC60 [Elysia marginata]|uniref:MICOS complex subunit MIC60 n=1 Tax=Elysia marginata TaxID=1093978 RepID=A0AAV4J444_9GAST|nr:MICOS complex subunit MIC60 [Elysia marginata]
MWKVNNQRQCCRIFYMARKHLSTEAAPPKPSPPPPAPPAPKKGGFGFFKFLGVTIPAVGGGIIGYAWYDAEFRKQMESNVPYAKEVFEAIFPSTEPKSPSTSSWPQTSKKKEEVSHLGVQNDASLQPLSLGTDPQQNSSLKTKNLFKMLEDPEKRLTEEVIAHRLNPLHGLTAPEVATQQSYLPQLQEIDLEQLLKSPPHEEKNSKGQSTALNTEKETDKKVEKTSEKQSVEAQLRRIEDEEKADNAAFEVAVHKLLTNCESLSEEAVKAQVDYASAVRNHTKLLRQAMDDTADILQKDAQWEAVAIAYSEREYAKDRAHDLIAEAKRTIENLREIINSGKSNKVTKQNPAIVPASKRISDFLKDISGSTAQIRQAESEANVMLKYKDLVDKGKKQFQKEIESLLPDVKIGNGKKLSEDELNALIAHAHRRIEQLQKQIAEHLAMERQRLNTALETQRQEDIHLTNSAVLDERVRLKQEFDVEQQKMEMEYLVKMEAEVRKQLARQAAAHSDHIKDVLAVQQDQLGQEFNRELHAKLLEEREKFQTEVAGWISRLKGIEAAVDARADSEKIARSAQDLWLACIALNAILHFGNESETDEKKPVPLRSKVEAILNSGMKHPFVETVANAIPTEALDKGVNTEDELRSRFMRVARICRRLGLVQAPNTSLYKYFVSYFHSFLVFDHISAEEPSDEVDLAKLDNFDLIAYAQYWMEKGSLELALKFMSQLNGESRKAASDWIRDARLLLETKQCAFTLTAFASATGLANTF